MNTEQFMTAKGRGVTIYARNPDMKYQFESIGRIVFWSKPQHTQEFNCIEIAGVMYTLVKAVMPSLEDSE